MAEDDKTGQTETVEADTEDTSTTDKATSDGRGGKDAVLADLARERRERQTLASKLKKLEDRDKTESQRAVEEAKEHQARAEKAEAELVRLRVAVAKGLTPSQAKRLVGTTEAELDADADELLKDYASAASVKVKPRPDAGQGNKETQKATGVAAGRARFAATRSTVT